MASTFEELRGDYSNLWRTMRLRADWLEKADAAAARISKNKSKYMAVEGATGVPWFVIGLFHMMESSGNFKKHLHNGDPLNEWTSNVPAGRPISGSPPFSWADSAADAIRYTKLHLVDDWCSEQVCYQLEKYNGWRSRTHHKINTPYLWSGSNHYLQGKYVRDNVWSATAVSKQTGAIPILKRLMKLDSSIAQRLDDQTAATVSATPEPGKPNSSSGNKAFNLVEVQLRLAKLPLYRDAVDGKFGHYCPVNRE